jgi:hypothetical protein
MKSKKYTKCRVCGRPLKSHEAQTRGAGTTCFMNSFSFTLTTKEVTSTLRQYKHIRLKELQAKAKARKNKA